MKKTILIFVEGKEDKSFIDSMLHVWYPKTSFDIQIQILEGNVLEGKHKKLIETTKNLLVCITILDADKDFSSAKEKIEEFDKNIKSYIFPNNQDNGNLETLLEKMILDEHKGILKCFESYENCIQGLNKRYKTPNQKAKIYAYLEALGVKKRTYTNKNIWNFKQKDLLKLKDFFDSYL